MNETTTKCLAILEKTAGGGYLTPRQRDLVEHGRDGHLNERGERIVDVLYRHICEEQWYFGLEHMTHDSMGQVFFKGLRQERFSHRWAYTPGARTMAVKMQQACLFLERVNLPGTLDYLMCSRPLNGAYADEFARDRQAALDALRNGAQLSFSLAILHGATFLLPGWPDEATLYEEQWFDGLTYLEKPANSQDADISYYLYGKGDARPATKVEINLLEACFEYLLETQQLYTITPSCPVSEQGFEDREGLER